MDLTDNQIERYARNLILDEIGEDGQAKLLASKVLVLGAGGLGAPCVLFLAASGIARLGIVDLDAVDLSNLQRQVLHGMAYVGRPKTESAESAIARINPEIEMTRHHLRLDASNVLELVRDYDLVA